MLGREPDGTHRAFDEPAHGVCAEAERLHADLVVCGRRGQSRTNLASLGSVSLRVAMNAHASVLVVP
jgi:nucleotide-binding universal stress UspA family protein